MILKLYEENKHYAMIAEWWGKHKWPITPPSMLPRLGVLVADAEDNDLCVGFLYCSDSKLAMIEFVVANPDPNIKRGVRSKGLDLLIEALKGHGKDMGFDAIFTSLSHRGLTKKFERAGFIAGDRRVTNLTWRR